MYVIGSQRDKEGRIFKKRWKRFDTYKKLILLATSTTTRFQRWWCIGVNVLHHLRIETSSHLRWGFYACDWLFSTTTSKNGILTFKQFLKQPIPLVARGEETLLLWTVTRSTHHLSATTTITKLCICISELCSKNLLVKILFNFCLNIAFEVSCFAWQLLDWVSM